MIEYIVIDFCMSNCMLSYSFFYLINKLVRRYGCIAKYSIDETSMSLTIKPNTKGVLIKPLDAAKMFSNVIEISEAYSKNLSHFKFCSVEFVPTLPF